MATSFRGSVSAVQVGSYFVRQYYQVLQQQPDYVHQFYTDASTMLLINGDTSETATAMLQIHSLIMSLNFTGIEIKTAHFLDSWNGGVLLMVSGSVKTKDFGGRKKFAQTFFLAPQEKGYFVLNDILHFLDEEQIDQHPVAILAESNFDSNHIASSSLPESVPDYIVGEDIQAEDFSVSIHAEESDPVDKYSLPETHQQQVSEVEIVEEETPVEESTAYFQSATDTVQEPPPVPVEEPVGELPKQTYASILRAKAQSAPSIAQPSPSRSAPPTSDWHYAPQPIPQQTYPTSFVTPEQPDVERSEEVLVSEEEGDLRSVYVKNLPSTVSVPDLEQEFSNFGRIKPEGVVIRNRKDVGIYFAFIEFEDAFAAQNAIKASPILFGGRQVYIVERRANNSSLSRGGRGRGRGRGSYQTEAPRGRFGGRSFGRGGIQDSGDRDFNSRSRGNGFHQRGSRQDRGILGSQESRNGPNSWETS